MQNMVNINQEIIKYYLQCVRRIPHLHPKPTYHQDVGALDAWAEDASHTYIRLHISLKPKYLQFPQLGFPAPIPSILPTMMDPTQMENIQLTAYYLDFRPTDQ